SVRARVSTVSSTGSTPTSPRLGPLRGLRLDPGSGCVRGRGNLGEPNVGHVRVVHAQRLPTGRALSMGWAILTGIRLRAGTRGDETQEPEDETKKEEHDDCLENASEHGGTDAPAAED